MWSSYPSPPTVPPSAAAAKSPAAPRARSAVETLEPRLQFSAPSRLAAAAPTPRAAVITPLAAKAKASSKAAAPVVETGAIAAKEVDESSGVAASRRHPGVFYTHNDSGNDAVLFALHADGVLVGRYALDVGTTDWEDVAVDNAGQVYVADTGDNKSRRATVSVLRVAEPAPGRAGRVARGTLAVDRGWTLRFPGGPSDAEAFFVSGRSGYLITKRKDGGRATLFRFPLKSGGRAQTLQEVTDLAITRPVTAADISPDGRRLSVASTGALYVYDLATPGYVASAGNAKPRSFALPDQQVEGVTFTPAGGLLLTAEETRAIFQVAASVLA